MGGTTYTVRAGDTIIRIADAHRFRSWETIWQAPENAGLRDQRPDPHVLAPGDRLYIPDKVTKEFDCATLEKHTFRLRAMTQHLRQRFLDEDGRPLGGRTYDLTVNGKTIRNATDGEGWLEEPVPVAATRAEVRLWLVDGDDDGCITYAFALGHLDPADTPAGVKARLHNLGYACGDPHADGLDDDATREAVRRFQREHGVAESGEVDDATRRALVDAHDHPHR
jgi:hypothetical protein